MPELNRDVLLLIFEELQDNSKFLFSCLMVNRLWCETAIPVLWKKPWCYTINYCNKISLYSIITSYLSDDVKEFLTEKGIEISVKSLAFDYLSFCRSIDIKIINDIISSKICSNYNQFLLQGKIYSFLIRKCPEIKYLNIRGTYDIVFLPEAKVRLESLCELTCDTSIDEKYFYRLAHICQQIQRIIIINNNYGVNHGATMLIEFQKNLKYFKWEDDFEDGGYNTIVLGEYTEIFHAVTKHANTLNYFEICLQVYYNNYFHPNNDYNAFLQYSILKLNNLKSLKIDSSIFLYPISLGNNDFNKKLEMVAYRDLEILDIYEMNIYQVTCIIKNSLYLRELSIYEYKVVNNKFIDESLNFIRIICENCFLIEYLSIPVFPLLDNHFTEFEKLLKKCQKLRSLHFKKTYYEKEKELEFGKYLLNVLVREASINLKEIRIPSDIRFSSITLETFFEKWKGRPAITILMDEPQFYQSDDSYKKLISKYKGVIKHINI